MPQVYSVGHRSLWVSAMAYLLMTLGLVGLSAAACAWWLGNLAALPLSLWAVLAVPAGFALLRRLEWGRWLGCATLLSLLPAMLLGLWLVRVQVLNVWVALICLALGAGKLGLLNHLYSRPVQQEFA
ncbi:MAG: hypothetical protein JOY60_09920 [Burkholderiaceae bacterium]|nr:hypothetical protein [Burkholderiaceae bacterium]